MEFRSIYRKQITNVKAFSWGCTSLGKMVWKCCICVQDDIYRSVSNCVVRNGTEGGGGFYVHLFFHNLLQLSGLKCLIFQFVLLKFLFFSYLRKYIFFFFFFFFFFSFVFPFFPSFLLFHLFYHNWWTTPLPLCAPRRPGISPPRLTQNEL